MKCQLPLSNAWKIGLIAIVHLSFLPFTFGQTPCSSAKIDEILAPRGTTKRSQSVLIDCSFKLQGDERPITKQLVFEGTNSSNVTADFSGVTINGGARRIIDIRSLKYIGSESGKSRWERPENIIIKNCKILGSVQIWGMGERENLNDLKESSRKSDHVERARNNAPTNILFDHVTITAGGYAPLYISPGVSYFKMINSEVNGNSNEVAIYLSAESFGNEFINNKIYTTTTRELIAIDGSSHNRIVNNWFSSLNHGGIFLYRNCGQDGIVRHSTPSYNTIINNVFYYNKYSGYLPAVFIGSRNGHKNYCDEDDDSNYGSGKSNLDYARNNVVAQNQIYKRNKDDMIRTVTLANTTPPDDDDAKKYLEWVKQSNSPNIITQNETVNSTINRAAGCNAGENGYQKEFITDGQTIEMLEVSNGEAATYNYTCRNGELVKGSRNSTVTVKEFECRIEHSNEICQKEVSCPAGMKIIGATGGCDLEINMVSPQTLRGISSNNILVLRDSDHEQSGSCWIGPNSISSGQRMIIGIDGLSKVKVGCKEHDGNGGDCHIKGALYCR